MKRYRFSVITANYNGAAYLEATLQSVIEQKDPALDLEYIVVDGGSTDGSHAILERYREYLDGLIIERDNGPAQAINKGIAKATGDIVSWLNADDVYFPQTLLRVQETARRNTGASFFFGTCPIINNQGKEIRRPITRFKEIFFPLHSRFTYQCINYISQPALFFNRSAVRVAGLLREDMVAAWDYEYILRLWRQGKGVRVPGNPLAAFRWHDTSISGQNFSVQFAEELAATAVDAGRFAPQTLIHHGVRWAIVGAYHAMLIARKRRQKKPPGQ